MRRDVYYFFQQACRREVRPVSVSQWVEQGNTKAAFYFEVDSNWRIELAEYRCTTCVTLLALCEHLAQELHGASIQEARELTSEHILRQHPEIPPTHRSRAQLAVAAAHAALENILV